jgi:hypothetical protein
MNAQEIFSRCSAANEEFDHHEQRSDGLRVIEGLCAGLTLIRDSVYDRVHADIERRMGFDSMIAPLSEEKSERIAKQEIEIYQIVVAAETAIAQGYVSDGNWFREWLRRLRLGEIDSNSRVALRISYYCSKSANDQRLAFGNILAATLPEASRAPLILLRLLPFAVQIATALGFQNSVDAQSYRHEQAEILPSILDCHHCHGKVLDNGEQCAMCGNPVWNYEWLTAADG